jgi:hypothetical protein
MFPWQGSLWREDAIPQHPVQRVTLIETWNGPRWGGEETPLL